MAKEIRISLNTAEGQAEFSTDKVKGKLDGIIVDSIEAVEIIIESELGYVLLHAHKQRGVKYYAPRAVLQGASQNLMVKDQFDKFSINEKILILVRGPFQDVHIILRFD